MVNAATLKSFLEKTLKDGATLQMAKDKLSSMDEQFLKAFADAGGVVYAATVQKAGALVCEELVLCSRQPCKSCFARVSLSTSRQLGWLWSA